MPYIEQWTVLRLQLNCHALSAEQYVPGKPASIGEIIHSPSLSARSPFFAACLISNFSEIETKWGVTLEVGRSVHTHQSSLAYRQGREKS